MYYCPLRDKVREETVKSGREIGYTMRDKNEFYKGPRTKQVRAVCRRCRAPQICDRTDFTRAAGARCYKCGGLLDKVSSRLTKPATKSMDHQPSNGDTLIYPAAHSEFEVQAYIYTTLRAKGYDVRGEVFSRLGAFRLDLVIYVDKRAVLVIETKALAKKIKGPDRKSLQKEVCKTQLQQLQDYATLGVPVASIKGMKQAIAYCESFDLEKARAAATVQPPS